jgi:hypothetical protein
MNRLKILAAVAAIGAAAGPLSLAAGPQQCGESSLLADHAASAGMVRENAELRSLPDESFKEPATALHNESVMTHPAINIDRSLYIRDKDILTAISLADVMDTLAAGLGADHPSGIKLFQDWWRTAARPDVSYAADIGCTNRLINGFSYTCPETRPRAEASLSRIGNLRSLFNNEPIFKIVGLVNRGDLVFGKPNPDTCGEYRVLAAANTVDNPVPRLDPGEFFLSFEAALPNQGGGMCLAVQRFWHSLANLSEADAGAQLRTFFLERVRMDKKGKLVTSPERKADFEFGPVISAANLGLLPDDASKLGISHGTPVGQIRTNSLDAADKWLLRQYSFRKTSLGLRITPTSLSATAPAEIFKPASGCLIQGKDCNTALGQKIAKNEAQLATDDIEKLSFYLGERCLEAGEMTTDTLSGYSYLIKDEDTSSNAAAQALETIAAEPAPPASRPEASYNLEMTSCAGCHRQTAPSKLSHLFANPGRISIDDLHLGMINNFTHSKLELEGDGQQYSISPLLKKVFLPWRAFVMEQTLKQ